MSLIIRFSEPFCQFDGTSEGPQLVVYFLQFGFDIAFGNDASSGLKPQFAVPADERTDNDGLVDVSVETDEPDASSISAPVVRFDFTDELHGSDLGRTAECTGGEGVQEGVYRVCTGTELSADTADKMDDMAVELDFLISLYVDRFTVAGKVIAGKVDEHGVLGVLFRIGEECIGETSVGDRVSGASGRSGYRVNGGIAVTDLAVCFG